VEAYYNQGTQLRLALGVLEPFSALVEEFHRFLLELKKSEIAARRNNNTMTARPVKIPHTKVSTRFL
jgi:hypothetical protein